MKYLKSKIFLFSVLSSDVSFKYPVRIINLYPEQLYVDVMHIIVSSYLVRIKLTCGVLPN